VACGHLCAEAFSGSGNPDERHPFGHAEAILARILAEGLLTFVEPRFQGSESPDVVHGSGTGVEFERAAFADDVPFFVQNLPDAPFVEPFSSGNHDSFAERPARFDDGKAERTFDHTFAQAVRGVVERTRRAGFAFEQFQHLSGVGLADIDGWNVVSEFGGKRKPGAGNDDVHRFGAERKTRCEVPQHARNLVAVFPEMVEVLEHECCRSLVVVDDVEHGFRGGRELAEGCRGFPQVPELVADIPGDEPHAFRPLARLRPAGKRAHGVLFVDGCQVYDGYPRVSVQFEFVEPDHVSLLFFNRLNLRASRYNRNERCECKSDGAEKPERTRST